MPLTVRRVVTGHDRDGKSIIVSDGPALQFHERSMFAEVWNTQGAPTPITAGEERDAPHPKRGLRHRPRR
jgi:hypothetical protein